MTIMCIVLCCCWVISTVQSSVLLSRIKNFHQTAAEQLTPIRGRERDGEMATDIDGGRERRERNEKERQHAMDGWRKKEQERGESWGV